MNLQRFITGGDDAEAGAADAGPGGWQERVANYDFAAAQEGDLAFESGETLWVRPSDEEGWFEAKNAAGKLGIAPENYF